MEIRQFYERFPLLLTAGLWLLLLHDVMSDHGTAAVAHQSSFFRDGHGRRILGVYVC